MELKSAAVLGGGPGGLYVARLIRRRHPGCRVDLYEQDPPGNTFGFGVGLATRTQRNLCAADVESFEAIVERAWRHDVSMAIDDARVVLPGGDLIAIGRAALLQVLREQAEAAGVVVHTGRRVDAADLEAELVVAADGIGSATRQEWAEVFEPTVTTHESLYLWAGTDTALPHAVFRPVTTQHGTFVAHAYPYQADRSTFLVETDPETWRRAGLDQVGGDGSGEGSDEASLAYLSDAFADELDGHHLIGNRTRWLQFRTVTCRRWHRGSVVLLGDAVHTAHYSIGSGTKLAMEDGIALVDALDDCDDVPSALERYEAERRPAVEHLQETAHRSMRWWDSFPDRLDLGIERLLVAYMSRAGKVGLERFAATAPAVVRSALAAWAGVPEAEVPDDDLTSWVLARGRAGLAATNSVRVRTHDAWDHEGTETVRRLEGAARVSLEPSDGSRPQVLTMLDVGERLRREAGAEVEARVPEEHRDLAAAALVSGRVDAVDVVDSLA